MSPEQIKNLQEMARQVFRKADSDGSGNIEKQELASLINQLSDHIGIEKIDEEEIDEVFEEFDENGDGVLQLDEFQNFVVQLFQIAQSDLHQQQSKSNKKKKKERKHDQSFTSSESDEEKDIVGGLEEEKISNKFFQKVRKGQSQKFETMNKMTRQLTRQSIILINKQKDLEEQIFKALNPNLNISKDEWEKQEKVRSLKRNKSIYLLQQQFERDSQKIAKQHSQIYRNKSVVTVCTSIIPKKDDQTIQMRELNSPKNISLPYINPKSNSVTVNGQQSQLPKLPVSNLNIQSLDYNNNNALDTQESRYTGKAQTTTNKQLQYENNYNNSGKFFQGNRNEPYSAKNGTRGSKGFQLGYNLGNQKTKPNLSNLYSQARKSVEVFRYQPHFSKGYSSTKHSNQNKKESVFYIIRDNKPSKSNTNTFSHFDNQEDQSESVVQINSQNAI